MHTQAARWSLLVEVAPYSIVGCAFCFSLMPLGGMWGEQNRPGGVTRNEVLAVVL